MCGEVSLARLAAMLFVERRAQDVLRFGEFEIEFFEPALMFALFEIGCAQRASALLP